MLHLHSNRTDRLILNSTRLSCMPIELSLRRQILCTRERASNYAVRAILATVTSFDTGAIEQFNLAFIQLSNIVLAGANQ